MKPAKRTVSPLLSQAIFKNAGRAGDADVMLVGGAIKIKACSGGSCIEQEVGHFKVGDKGIITVYLYIPGFLQLAGARILH